MSRRRHHDDGRDGRRLMILSDAGFTVANVLLIGLVTGMKGAKEHLRLSFWLHQELLGSSPKATPVPTAVKRRQPHVRDCRAGDRSRGCASARRQGRRGRRASASKSGGVTAGDRDGR